MSASEYRKVEKELFDMQADLYPPEGDEDTPVGKVVIEATEAMRKAARLLGKAAHMADGQSRRCTCRKN